MSFQVYKPNSKNTGCAFNFYIMNAGQKREPSLFIGGIKQFSWDAKTRLGSFDQNKDKPEKNINVKFNEFEAGEILSSLKNRYEWSTIHVFEDNKTSIKFSPWDKPKEVYNNATKKKDTITIPAFGIVFTRNGSDTFRIPVEPGEVERIISLLESYLKRLDTFRFNAFVNKNKK